MYNYRTTRTNKRPDKKDKGLILNSKNKNQIIQKIEDLFVFFFYFIIKFISDNQTTGKEHRRRERGGEFKTS